MKVGNLKILVRPNQKKEQAETKIGSIIVPGTVRHKKVLTEGEVIACGNGTPEIPMEVEVGETILFYNMEDRPKVHDMVLIDMNDVLFVLDEKPKYYQGVNSSIS